MQIFLSNPYDICGLNQLNHQLFNMTIPFKNFSRWLPGTSQVNNMNSNKLTKIYSNANTDLPTNHKSLLPFYYQNMRVANHNFKFLP